ncbi:hypothetical protein AAFF_G00236250 [Aldrovandia affinis]|uniref:WD repeat and coiled-coil-containing protein n=1 Tax=Aldrovandia affinis TaxID=143900 RepID=A0AAD7REW1_9TELE|nr:hypothetical protein AAFF_G00236250 [Aldrovandia affinis]
MDLGKVTLPRTGVNALHQAVHAQHGVAWTDGERVSLTPLRFDADERERYEPQFGARSVAGRFEEEEVLAVRWGPGSPALLAVQHRKRVTVWEVSSSSASSAGASDASGPACAQTCDVSEPLPLLAQGCVWHPSSDALALLTRRGVSVICDVRSGARRRVGAELRGGGAVRLACWTGDGTRLVVAVGSALLSYAWDGGAGGTLTPCGSSPAFDLGRGQVCALEPAGVPRRRGDRAAPGQDLRAERGHGVRCAAQTSAFSALPAGGGRRWLRAGLTPALCAAAPGALLGLRRRDTLTGSGRDSAHLLLVSYEGGGAAAITARVRVPGVLAPDLVAWGPGGRAVAVASSACGAVLVYAVTGDRAMSLVQRVPMQADERPKGVSFLSAGTLLLMVATLKPSDTAFLPSSSSNTHDFLARLVTKELVYDEGAEEEEGESQRPRRISGTLASASEGQGGGGGGACRTFPPRRAVWRDSGAGPAGRGGDLPWREEEEACRGEAFDTEHVGLAMGSLDLGRRAAPPRFEASDKGLSDPPPPPPPPPRGETQPLEQPSWAVEPIFAEVQRGLSEVRDFTPNGRKARGRYPPSSEPPYAIVTCQKQLCDGVFVDERRLVLLCEGKLCLRVLQDLFSLPVLEMMCGPQWIVLVADAEGFVPLTFKPREELTVRSGKRNSPVCPGSGEGLQVTQPPHTHGHAPPRQRHNCTPHHRSSLTPVGDAGLTH